MIGLLIWTCPANLLADEGVRFSLDVSKELLTRYEILLDYKEHNEKLVGLLQGQNDKLKLSIVDYETLDLNYKEQVYNLETQIANSTSQFNACEGRAEKWKLEYGQCNEDLAKALSKPWYYVHLPSIGYGAILTLLLMGV